MRIAIIGAGWLGWPLAQKLQQQDHSVRATSRNPDKRAALTQLGMQAFDYSLGTDLTAAELQPLLCNDVLVLNIAPGPWRNDRDGFSNEMQALLRAASSGGTQKVIMLSTTAVYGDAQGEVVEQSATQPQTGSAIAHVAIEQSLLELFGQGGVVLRLAGLVGEDRHPVRSLVKKSPLSDPQLPVNLVHRQDVIQAIEGMLHNWPTQQILHLCSSEHPTRGDYYTWAAKQLGLPAPQFAPPSDKKGKLINPAQTLAALGLSLRYPSPFDML